MADQEATALANPPVAPQPQPEMVPSLYTGLRVVPSAINQVVGGILPATEELKAGADYAKKVITDHKTQGDFLMGIAGTGEFGTGEFGTGEGPEGAAELEGEAKKLFDGLRVRKAADVMVQPQSTSKATPMGESASLPAEVHADLEKQAGRELSDDEAVALDRANLERGMVSAPQGDTNAIRESKRDELEKPRSASTESGQTPKEAIEKAGMKYKGELTKGSGVHLFEHPDHPGKTASLNEPEITPEAVKAKMTSKLAEFDAGKKLGKK